MEDRSDLLAKKKGIKPKAKWIAVIVAVIIIVAAIATVISLRAPTPPATPAATASANAFTGEPFNLTINAGAPFKDMTVYFGDGTSTTVGYSNSSTITVQHVYAMPGDAYIYYSVLYSNGAVYSASNKLVPVQVLPSSSYITTDESLGAVTYNTSASSTPLVIAQNIFSPGSFVNFTFTFYNQPSNTAYQVVNQTAEIGNGKIIAIPYTWSSAQKHYELSTLTANMVNNTFSKSGLYIVNLTTRTAMVNTTTGAYSSSTVQSSQVFFDVAVFSSGNVASYNANSIITRAELETGSYRTLDPAVADDSVSLEIIWNVYQQLIKYNGSSTSSVVPELLSYIPSISNGGINTNYKNYTVTDPWGTTYAVNVTPYENFTFHIRTNASFQNGQPVTSWDALYSFARQLLFDNGAPGTGGWVMGQYVLPGNYRVTNTFWNITQNITVNNATNNITIHFQKPMTPTLVFQLLVSYGGITPMDASWLIAHGAGITWSPVGFQAYKSQGDEAHYNTYIQNNVMADGPYEVAYTIPSTEVVLKVNPAFVSPGPWYPKPTIETVVLQYTGSQSTIYLEMKSGKAQIGTIESSSWYLAQSLESSGVVKNYGVSTPTIFFYSINANINQTILHTVYPGANVPSALFSSLYARKALAYAYNYQYYLNDQVGNKVYNTTFGSAFAGMLPKGILGYQSISQLNNTTTGVPYFDLAMAAHYWGMVNFAKYNITNTSSGYMYKGKPLVIPIFILTGDSTELAGATTWGDNLATFITGATFPVIPIAFPVMLGYHIPNQNPMPIYQSGWAMDYPYPTDYMGTMALPSSNSGHTGVTGFYPAYMEKIGHAQQAQELQSMISEYNNGTNATSTTVALHWFHKMNEELVNLTYYVDLYQESAYYTVSTRLNGNDIVNYQENVKDINSMIYYNLMSYNSTSST
ncbi:MAG: ABC transporter substrate-binding protein [Thermoplasmataceae archaeon]